MILFDENWSARPISFHVVPEVSAAGLCLAVFSIGGVSHAIRKDGRRLSHRVAWREDASSDQLREEQMSQG